MNDIWNEAPEGATHYTPANETECLNAVYWRVLEGVSVKAWAVREDGSLSECRSPWAFDFTRPDAVTRPWTGSGLPPVGTVCECQDERFHWQRGTIVHVGKGDGAMVAVMQADNGILIGESGEFRQLRTPEQIAAEERRQGIEAMAKILGVVACDDYVAATAIYDAGYRKVTP